MRVKSCVASDGGGHTIQLSDEFGCVLRPKMISRFLKARGSDDRATVITYAFFHAFKFPDALSVHIKCKVSMNESLNPFAEQRRLPLPLGELRSKLLIIRRQGKQSPSNIYSNLDKLENIFSERWRYAGTVVWITVS